MDKNKLFVGNLSWKTTPEQLKAHFEAIGEVLNVKIVTDAATGRSKGFGFVEMKDSNAAATSIRELNDKPLLDRNLRVSLAEERKDRGDRGSSDRGDRGGERRSGGYGGGQNDSYGSRSNFRNSVGRS